MHDLYIDEIYGLGVSTKCRPVAVADIPLALSLIIPMHYVFF